MPVKKKSTTVRFRLDPKKPPKLTRKQQARLDAMTDDDIDYSDIPEMDERFFRLVDAFTPHRKKSLTLRLDEPIYRWLKSQGPGYQTRINAILKAAMLFQSKRL